MDMDNSLPARFPITSNDATNTLRQIHDVTNNFNLPAFETSNRDNTSPIVSQGFWWVAFLCRMLRFAGLNPINTNDNLHTNHKTHSRDRIKREL